MNTLIMTIGSDYLLAPVDGYRINPLDGGMVLVEYRDRITSDLNNYAYIHFSDIREGPEDIIVGATFLCLTPVLKYDRFAALPVLMPKNHVVLKVLPHSILVKDKLGAKALYRIDKSGSTYLVEDKPKPKIDLMRDNNTFFSVWINNPT